MRAELIRSRGFIRGAETQLTKSLTLLDAYIAEQAAPPPVPASGAPAYDATRHQLVYRDSFDQYASVDAMGSVDPPWPRIVPIPSPVTVSKPVNPALNELIAEGAGKAIRMKFSGAYQAGADFFLRAQVSPGDAVTNYFQYDARLTYPGGPDAVKGIVIAPKWFMLWHRRATGLRAQFNIHEAWSPGCTADLSKGPRARWQFYDGNTETPCQAFQPLGPWPYEIADAQKHRFVHVYRPQSAVGALDGFAQMYVDGKKIIDVSKEAIGVTPSGGDKPWCVDADVRNIFVQDGIGAAGDRSAHWGGPHTGDPVQPWTLDVHDFTWWTTQ